MALQEADRALRDMAYEVIRRNLDTERNYHTVGCALRCKNGKIYLGVNCDGIHGACAEFIAIGAAITAGERDFDCIVAVWGRDGAVISPCGNCRQMLFEYAPDIHVLVTGSDGPEKQPLRALLPFAYEEKLGRNA